MAWNDTQITESLHQILDALDKHQKILQMFQQDEKELLNLVENLNTRIILLHDRVKILEAITTAPEA